jgi:isoleucyl-tRNA synthetase
MPFLTEEMYQNLVVQVSKEAPESVHLCEFPVSESRYIDEKLEKEVMSTRTIVSLGRAARSKANIKVRQPLSEMIVNVPRNGFELSDDDKAIILEELNIKRIKSSGHNVLEKILVFNATPLLNSLGPKFGSDLNRIVEWIKALGQEDIQRLAKLNSLKRDINGKVVELTKDDVDIQRVGIPGWSVVTEDEFGVGINTEISSDLENEGLVRELIHKIQLMRKQADFDLTDRIKVHYQTEPKLKQAITKNIDYLKNETLAVEVLEGAVQGEAGGVLSINGIETKVVLERVKTT